MGNGYAVQLVHDGTETTSQDHGFVRVKASNGTTLAESSSYQHNPWARTVEEKTSTLIASMSAELAEGTLPTKGGEVTEGKVMAATDSDGSTKAASEEAVVSS